MMISMTINEALVWLTKELVAVCLAHDQAQQEAWWLLEKATTLSKMQLLMHKNDTLAAGVYQQLSQWLAQCIVQHKPLQYILGNVPFCGLTIDVKQPILIPRPETEEWTMWLIAQLRPLGNRPIRILDMCTGSGCIALALAHALPNAQVVGSDKNPAAIALAQENQKNNNVSNVTFVISDAYEAFRPEHHFDLIVANPPYLTQAEYEQLSPTVKNWEDADALQAADEGLAVYRAIITQAHAYLNASSDIVQCSLPSLIVELGTFVAPVHKLFIDAGFSKVSVHHDLQGVPRWLAGRI